MIINTIKLENFRNYTKKSIDLDSNLNLISGPNGSGKTNIIEALYLLSHGKSKRVQKESELINIYSQFSKITGSLDNSDKLEILMSKKDDSPRISKVYKINGVQKTGVKFIGTLKSVLFAPEDIRLVAGSPSRRRDYIDGVLSQVDYQYRVHLSNYNKILKQRNKVLEKSKGQYIENIFDKEIIFWDEQLIKNAEYLQSVRSEFFDYSQIYLKDISNRLFKKNLYLKLEYFKNTVNKEKLEKLKTRELLTGVTQSGPHRDDFGFFLMNDMELDLKSYGSRGEQRTGVFCVKLLELKFIEDKTKEIPLLLLDDIFSELDPEHRKAIYDAVTNHQTIISTADLKMVPENISSKALLIEL